MFSQLWVFGTNHCHLVPGMTNFMSRPAYSFVPELIHVLHVCMIMCLSSCIYCMHLLYVCMYDVVAEYMHV